MDGHTRNDKTSRTGGRRGLKRDLSAPVSFNEVRDSSEGVTVLAGCDLDPFPPAQLEVSTPAYRRGRCRHTTVLRVSSEGVPGRQGAEKVNGKKIIIRGNFFLCPPYHFVFLVASAFLLLRERLDVCGFSQPSRLCT